MRPRVRSMPPDTRSGTAGTTLVELVTATSVVALAVAALGVLAGSLESTVRRTAVAPPTGVTVDADLGRLLRPATTLLAADGLGLTVRLPEGEAVLAVGADGTLTFRAVPASVATGPAVWRTASDAVGLVALMEDGTRLAPAGSQALEGSDLARVAAVVLVDAAGDDLLVVALRDRWTR